MTRLAEEEVFVLVNEETGREEAEPEPEPAVGASNREVMEGYSRGWFWRLIVVRLAEWAGRWGA